MRGASWAWAALYGTACALAYAFIATSPVHAQVSPPPLDLFLPDQMILGEHYTGLVTYTAGDEPALAQIRAPDDRVDVKESVLVKRGESHALFAITPLSQGEAEISISLDGRVVSRSVSITAESTDTDLQIIIPSSTRTPDLLGAVYLVDRAGNAVVANATITVTLSTTPGLTTPESIRIPRGSTAAVFHADVFGPGRISAASGPMFDTQEVMLVSDEPVIRIGLAPEAITPNSFAYYVVWFERNGQPYIPPSPVQVTVHTSNHEIASLDSIQREERGDFGLVESFIIEDGVAYGRLYTHMTGSLEGRVDTTEEGTLSVTANGYGIDTVGFTVGGVTDTTLEIDVQYEVVDRRLGPSCTVQGSINPEFYDYRIDKDEVDLTLHRLRMACDGNCVVLQDDRAETRSVFEPNQIRASILPEDTFGEAYLIPSIFSTKQVDFETEIKTNPGRQLYFIHSYQPDYQPGTCNINSVDHPVTAFSPGLSRRDPGCPTNKTFLNFTDSALRNISIPDASVMFNGVSENQTLRGLATFSGSITGLGDSCRLSDLDPDRSRVFGTPFRNTFGNPDTCFCASTLNGALQRVDRTQTTHLMTDFFMPSAVVPSGHGGTGGVRMYISSNGADHPTSWILEPEEIPTQSGILPISGTPNSYDVSVTRPGVIPDGDDVSSFTVVSAAAEPNKITILPLPTVGGLVQDLALVYVSDPDGAVLDPADEFGTGVEISLDALHIDLYSEKVLLNSPVSIIRGALTGGLEASIIEGSTGTLFGTSVNISEKKAVPGGTVVIFAPAVVRAGEPFPAAAHLVDEESRSQNISHLIEAAGGCRSSGGGLFTCQSDGRLSVFEDFGNAKKEVGVFRSDLSADVRPLFSGPLSVGGNYTVVVEASVDGHSVFADTRIPHVTGDGVIHLLPDEVGEQELTVVVTAPGYTQYQEVVTIQVNNEVTVGVRAFDGDGRLLGIEASLQGVDADYAGITPYRHEFEQEDVTVSFPQTIQYGGNGYAFVESKLDNGGTVETLLDSSIAFTPANPSEVSALYKQVVVVEVVNGLGSGLYDIGEAVTIEAPERDVFVFLVREVLDTWTSDSELPDPFSSMIVLVPEDDITVEAIYRTDYTYMVLLIGAAGAAMIFMVFRSNNTYMLRMGQLTDSVSRLAGLFRTKKKPVVSEVDGDDA